MSASSYTLLPPPKRLIDKLRRAEYVGASIVQSPGSWNRVGAVWMLRPDLWVCYGPGLYDWGTTRGLGELCVNPGCSPEWHPAVWTSHPSPNCVMHIEDNVLATAHMSEVRTIVEWADAWVEIASKPAAG